MLQVNLHCSTQSIEHYKYTLFQNALIHNAEKFRADIHFIKCIIVTSWIYSVAEENEYQVIIRVNPENGARKTEVTVRSGSGFRACG